MGKRLLEGDIMFRQLAALTRPGDVFLYHPSELAYYLETVWALRSPNPPFNFRANRPSPAMLSPLLANTRIPPLPAPTQWNHLIYAYLIESTAIYEIFDRVMHECLNGERFGSLSPEGQMWIRNTEDMFYKTQVPFTIFAIKSDIRPDPQAVRQNAYYRMFGRDLPQAMNAAAMNGDNPYAFVKPEASNLEFTDTLEEFLKEAWIGIENASNTSGPRPTDNQAIANLARRLYEMLTDRRQYGNLSREEFYAVAMLSWYHLTVEFNSPILLDLRAHGTSPEERLRKVGGKVAMPPHAKSDSYFQVAEPLARILTVIETGQLNQPGTVPILYRLGQLRNDVENIVTHWSLITGRMMKANKVTVSPA
jgi:hypothetical protein